jgi:hypothetical protein
VTEKSHIDINKLNAIPSGRPFEYKDVVMEEFPVEKRTEDGKKFKAEVENGEFDAVIIEDDTDRVQYRKL